MKGLYEGLERGRVIAFGVYGNEDRRDFGGAYRVFDFKGVERFADDGDIRGADVWAIGVAEIHQPVLAGEVFLSARRAVLIDKRKGAAEAAAFQISARYRNGGELLPAEPAGDRHSDGKRYETDAFEAAAVHWRLFIGGGAG